MSSFTIMVMTLAHFLASMRYRQRALHSDHNASPLASAKYSRRAGLTHKDCYVVPPAIRR